MLYQFLRRLATPFEKWKAFASGVIDKDGNILIKREDRTADQKTTFSKFDLLVLKLKKLLAKIPGGSTRIASYAAALWLIKESEEVIENAETLTEEDMHNAINRHMILAEQYSSVNDKYELFEETTAAASNVAQHYTDMGADYGKNKKKKMQRRKKPTDEDV